MSLKRIGILLLLAIIVFGSVFQSGCKEDVSNTVAMDVNQNAEEKKEKNTTPTKKPQKVTASPKINFTPTPQKTKATPVPQVKNTSTPTSGKKVSPTPTPLIKNHAGISADEIKRLGQYEDFVCWLYIEDTNISNYVVQADNNDFYLRRNIDKQTNGNGSLFMDYRCNHDTWERHNIIYGHNQKNGTMFSDLINFMDPTFFRSHPYIYTCETDSVKKWRIFSAYETHSDNYYIETKFADDTAYYRFIRNFQRSSLASTNVRLKRTDKVLTLSTCHKVTNPKGRFVVHAVLIEESPL